MLEVHHVTFTDRNVLSALSEIGILFEKSGKEIEVGRAEVFRVELRCNM